MIIQLWVCVFSGTVYEFLSVAWDCSAMDAKQPTTDLDLLTKQERQMLVSKVENSL